MSQENVDRFKEVDVVERVAPGLDVASDREIEEQLAGDLLAMLAATILGRSWGSESVAVAS